MAKFDASVVIPAYNEQDYVAACLQSLTWQKTKTKFEVILIDNNSTDNTNKIANSFKDKLNIRVIVEKQQGRGVARWRGFEEANGKIIFSTDADTILPEDWVERFMKYFANKEIVAVTSLCNIDEPSRVDKAVFKFFVLLANEGHRIALGHYWLSGFSYAIRKNAYIKAGGINKDLDALDDIDLGRRVRKLGKIKLVRNLPVLSSSRRFKGGVTRGLVGYVKPFIRVAIFKNRNFKMHNVR